MDPILKMSLLISSHRFKYTTQGHTAGNLEKNQKQTGDCFNVLFKHIAAYCIILQTDWNNLTIWIPRSIKDGRNQKVRITPLRYFQLSCCIRLFPFF